MSDYRSINQVTEMKGFSESYRIGTGTHDFRVQAAVLVKKTDTNPLIYGAYVSERDDKHQKM